MKKLVVLFFLAIISWSGMNAGRQPILPYDAYSPEQVKVFALKNEVKSLEFREKLVDLVNRKLADGGVKERISNTDDDIKMVFDNTRLDEVDLRAGSFKNSFWDTDSMYIGFGDWSLTSYKDWAGVTKLYGVTFVLYKYDCVNLLDTPVLAFPEPPKPFPFDEVAAGAAIREPKLEPKQNVFEDPDPEPDPILPVEPVKIKKKTWYWWVLGVIAVIAAIVVFGGHGGGSDTGGNPGGSPITPGGSGGGGGPGGAPLTP